MDNKRDAKAVESEKLLHEVVTEGVRVQRAAPLPLQANGRIASP